MCNGYGCPTELPSGACGYKGGPRFWLNICTSNKWKGDGARLKISFLFQSGGCGGIGEI